MNNERSVKMKIIVMLMMMVLVNADYCHASWRDVNENLSTINQRSNKSDTVLVESGGVIIPVTVAEGDSRVVHTSCFVYSESLSSYKTIYNNPGMIQIFDSKGGIQTIYKDER
jgi:formylmethanofuran dehydrogenase subunit A